MQEAGAVLGPFEVVISYLKRCVAHRWSVLGQGRNHEALVFLHGFNCCLADACKRWPSSWLWPCKDISSLAYDACRGAITKRWPDACMAQFLALLKL